MEKFFFIQGQTFFSFFHEIFEKSHFLKYLNRRMTQMNDCSSIFSGRIIRYLRREIFFPDYADFFLG